MTQEIPLLDLYLEKDENTNSKRHMYHIVHSIIIYNAAVNLSVSINRWMEKDVVYEYTAEYCSAFKRRKSCHLQQLETKLVVPRGSGVKGNTGTGSKYKLLGIKYTTRI